MDRIVLDECVVQLEDGPLLHVIWNRGVRVEAASARAVVDAINRLADGAAYPLLVEMSAMEFLSNGAREVFAEPSAASRIAMLGTSPVDRMLVSYQLGTGQVPCPARFFTCRVEAMSWLQGSEATGETATSAAS